MTTIVTDYPEINRTNVNYWISVFTLYRRKELIDLGKYYDGKNSIIKKGAVANRPNYSINVNLAQYIVDVQAGYFMGQPVTYDFIDKQNSKEIQEAVEPILLNNYSEEEDFALASDASCYGSAYEVMMIDPKVDKKQPIENRLKFAKLDSENTFMVVDNTPLRRPICAITMYLQQTNPNVKNYQWQGYIYTPSEIIEFSWSGNVVAFKNRFKHTFGEIPVIEFKNNNDEKGDFETITGLLDAISLAVSNNTDDLQSIANAILAIYGASGTEEDDIKAINSTRTAKLPTGSKMEYVVKNLNVEGMKFHIENILKLIYQIGKTPDLSSDDFGGNQSGVAMEFKLWGLEQSRLAKARSFKKGLIKRLRLILNMVNLSKGSDYEILKNVNITFYKNLPKSDSAVYEMVAKLQGIVSDKTLLSQIPFIKDADAEMKQKQEEKQEEVSNFVDNYDGLGQNNNKEDNQE